MDDPNVAELASKCKSIKLMPSLEETLYKLGFDMTLEIHVQLWLDQLKITWKTWKKNAAVETHVDSFFRARPDAFRIALIFVIRCEEFKDCKPKSLPFFMMEALLKFSDTSKLYADESLKKPAFHAAIYQRNQHFFSLMVKTYQLESIKEYVIPIVNDMIKDDGCRQASQIVMAMNMYHDIPVEKLLFPLILQDKSNMIDEYLTQCPSLVKPLLAFLDKLLDKNFNTMEFVKKYADDNNIDQARFEKMHYKPLGKLVARLCNKFNVPLETCANLSKNRTTGGLRYLIYQKYVGNNVSSTVWDDLVRDSLRQHPDSAPAFIDMLVDYDTAEALKWAHHLNLPDNQLPLAIRGTQTHKKNLKEPEEENWDATDSSQNNLYHKSPLKRDQIVIIDSGEKFYNLINSELVNQEVVSMDCEWKPSFGAKQSQVAIIQIGTNDKVYLIDSILLNKQEYVHLWHSFNKSFLDNAEMIKLGFGLEQDLREMKGSIVGLGNIKVKGEGFLDLCTLWKSLLNHKLCLPTSSENGSSLSCVVQSCFGKPLEKSEQCSNWELRPLRESQIEYAALDAHILLQIYYFLQTKCAEQKICFEEICNDVMVESKKKATKKPKVVEKLQKSFLHVFETKFASEIKFLVEPMLENLMCYLRYCGIDTCVVPSPNMLWHDIVNLAISEERFVLIIKPKYTPTENYPQSSILSVGKVPILEQLHNIMNTYKVIVEQSHIFSICLYCNSKDLKKLNAEEAQQICIEYIRCNANTSFTKYIEQNDGNEEDYYSNFISDSDDDDNGMPQCPPAITSYTPAENKTYKTTKGATIEITHPQKFLISRKPAILCETCGKFYFKQDELLKSVSNIVFQVTNMTHQLE